MNQKIIIRAKTFRAWFNRNYGEDERRYIREFGASYGSHGLICYRDASAFYDRFEDEIWNLALSNGGSVAELLENQALPHPDHFKKVMVAAAAEALAAE